MGELDRHELQRDRTIQFGVVRAIALAHAADAEQRLNFITPESLFLSRYSLSSQVLMIHTPALMAM